MITFLGTFFAVCFLLICYCSTRLFMTFLVNQGEQVILRRIKLAVPLMMFYAFLAGSGIAAILMYGKQSIIGYLL